MTRLLAVVGAVTPPGRLDAAVRFAAARTINKLGHKLLIALKNLMHRVELKKNILLSVLITIIKGKNISTS